MKTMLTRLLTIVTCLSILISQNHVIISTFAEEFSETEQEVTHSLNDDSEQFPHITDDDEFLTTDEYDTTDESDITEEENISTDNDVYIDEDIIAAIDDEPVFEIAADNGLPGDWDKAMHFVIRHWHSEPVFGTTFQNASEINVDANRYFVVLEGYIVPDTNPDPANSFNPDEGDKYKFYLVYQDDVTTNGGRQKGDIEQIRVNGTFVTKGAYVLSIDQQEGVITLKANPTANEHFSGLSISAGRRAINQIDAKGGTDNAIEIKYDQYTHLVKGHMFYIHDFKTVEGSDKDSVFGTSEEADPEIDTAMVSGKKYYRTTEGLHTDKTASANANGDNRTFDIDLEAWYSEGRMAQIGMVLDASGSMAFTSDRTTVIDIDNFPDEIRKQLEYKRGALAKEVAKAASGEYTYPQRKNMIGYYAFNKGEYSDLKREWFLNGTKSASFTTNDNDYAKLVNYGNDSDAFDFKNGQLTLKDLDTDANGAYKNEKWGGVPMNFDASNGLNLARTTSALVLEESADGDFTVSFSLMKNGTGEPENATAEILYIGAPTGKRSDGSFFHVIYSDNKIIAKQGDNGEVIASFDFNDTAKKYISYVFEKNDSADTYTVTAYLDGKQIGVYRDLKLSGSNIVFSPFEDSYSSSNSSTPYKLFVDDIYSYSAALSGDEISKLISLSSAGTDINKKDAIEINWRENVFLTPNEVDLLLSPHNTDNTILGVGGYSYFVYDRRESTAEYAPLAYWDGVNAETISGDVKVAKTGDGSVLGQYYNDLTTEKGRKGWYYLTHGGSITNDYEKPNLMTAKRLVALGKSYNNNTVKDDVGAEGVPRDQTDSELKSGDTNAEFSSDTYMTIPFYIDENGHLRCFYTSNTSAQSIVNGSAYSSYVYELADKSYVKTESLQRALSLFVTELEEKSPESKVAAVRFSATNFSANNLLSHLVMLDWTNDSSESAAIMNIRRGDRSTTGTDLSSGGLLQYNYGLTGSTSTVTGLEAFKKYLIDNNKLYKSDQDKYLIIFTDGLDTDLSSSTNADKYYSDLTLTKEEDVDILRGRIRGETVLKDNKTKETLEVYKKAKELKESGYTIFTVMLAGGPIVEGTADYIRAKTLLEELSGNKDSNPKEAEGKYYFSTVYEEKKKRVEIKADFAISNMLSDSRSDEGKREYLKEFIRYDCVNTFAEFIHQYYLTEFEGIVFEKYPDELSKFIREYHENRFNDALFDKYLSDCFGFILKSYPEDACKLILDDYFDVLEELIINDNPDIFKGMTDEQKSEKADEIINEMSYEEIIEAFYGSDLAEKVASKILKNMNMKGRSETAEMIIAELQLNDDDLKELARIALNTLTSWEKSEVADDIINDLNGDELAEIADELIINNGQDINVIIELIINALPDEDKTKLADDILSKITPEEEQRLDDLVDKYYVDNVNSADLLAKIFTTEILSLIVHSKDSYTVKDYIDPRFDLVEEDGTIWQLKANGIVTKKYPADKNMPDETFKVKRAHAFTSADQLTPDVPYLSYDSENDIYYLEWKEQTIPSCRVGAETLRVWHGKITLRAKNDFIGGNGVLTNGNEENMNWVYFEDDPHKSSGTDDMKVGYYQENGVNIFDEYPSKGFPRTIVNVSSPTSTAARTSTIYMGEELSLDEIIQELMSIDTFDPDGSLSTALYWDYLQRYAYSSNSPKYNTLKKILELLKPKKTDTEGCFVLPYYYLPDDPVDPDNQTGSKDKTDGARHTGDCLGYLIYTWQPGSRQYPTDGIVKDTISRQSKLTVTFVPFNINGRTGNESITDVDELISSYIEKSGSNLNIETIKERLNAATDISYACPELNGSLVKDENYKWNKDYKPVVGTSVPMQTTIDDSMTKNIVSGEVALQMELDKDVINGLLDKNALKVGDTIKYTVDLHRDGKKIGTFTAEYEISGRLTSNQVVYAGLELTTNFIKEYGRSNSDDGSHKKDDVYTVPTYGLPLGTYTLTNPTFREYNGLEFSKIESVEININNQDQFSANDDILKSLLYFDADGVPLDDGIIPEFKVYPAPTECDAVATAYLGMREHTKKNYLNDRYALFTVKITAGDYDSPEYELPKTGGSGTDSIVFTGFLIILSAAGMMIFIRTRRRYRRSDVR